MPYVGNQAFNRGEISPLSIHRSDTDFYMSAVLRMENWEPLPLGPARRRAPWWAVEGSGVELDNEPYVITEPLFNTRVVVYIWADVTAANTADFYVTVRTLDQEGVTDTYALWKEGSAGISSQQLATGVTVPDDIQLSLNVTHSLFGPSLFVASPYFPPFRIVDGDPPQFEDPTWYEELVGTVAADLSGSSSTTTLEGTDTLFTEQVEVGDLLRIQGSHHEVASVTNDTSLDVVSGDAFTNSFAGERAGLEWDSPFGGENPRLVTVYRNRLIFSSTPSAPVRVWAAKPTDPFVVRPGSTHDNAPIEVDLFAEGASEFLWIAAQDQLFFGGARGEYALVVEGDTGLTPTNFVFNRVGSVGGSAIPPEFADATTYFVGPDRRKLYATQFEFQRQGLVTKETTLLNPELVDSPIRSIALRSPREGDSAQRIYLTLESGEVRILTVQEAAGVQAWSRLTIPSNEAFSGTGVVGVRALEGEAFLVFHSGVTGEANTTLFSLGEYEGTSGVCDFPRDLPVSSGSVSLPHYLRNQTLAVWDENGVFLELIEGTGTLDVSEYTTSRVTVAVPVPNRITPLPLHMQMSGGTMVNRRRRVPRVMVGVRDTNDLQYNGTEMLPAFPNDDPKYQTGTFRHWQLGWSYGDEDVIQSNGFYKATLLSLTREVKT